mmetsp:Transcript_51058/g.164178  ORF Transcript_51058/g.164178 Transcript_51058/m.164178 type:complete len:207 (-) Transcript_51058:83-703(-)
MAGARRDALRLRRRGYGEPLRRNPAPRRRPRRPAGAHVQVQPPQPEGRLPRHQRRHLPRPRGLRRPHPRACAPRPSHVGKVLRGLRGTARGARPGFRASRRGLQISRQARAAGVGGRAACADHLPLPPRDRAARARAGVPELALPGRRGRREAALPALLRAPPLRVPVAVRAQLVAHRLARLLAPVVRLPVSVREEIEAALRLRAC